MTVGDFKANFSEVLKKVLNGEEVARLVLGSGAKNKKEKLIEWVTQHQLQWQQVLFMGDDIPDYFPMQMVGLACCPADAVNEIKNISKYISPVIGGKGCGRDVIEKVLKLNGHWDLDNTTSCRSQDRKKSNSSR